MKSYDKEMEASGGTKKVADAKLENLGGCWFDVLPNGQITAGRIITVIDELNSSESL